MNIEKPEIFPKNKIKAGVTERNIENFPPYGLSVFSAKILSKEKCLSHINALASHLGISADKLKFQKQTHGTNINIIVQGSKVDEADGMISSTPGLFLCIKIADCCAILIYDSVKEVVAGFHSGWRGTMQNIVSIGIKRMQSIFDCEPGDLLAYLSPAASCEKYEVGWDVAKYFPETTMQIDSNKYLFDNKKQIYKQLIEAGLKEQRIEISPICTITDTRFHSYRRDGDYSGRAAAFIGMS